MPPPRAAGDGPAAALNDLDAAVRRVDPDRWLASRFIGDPAARADVIALYAFDHELARAARVASSPLIAEIRLAWWREALDEIFEGRPVRRHPTAQALAALVARRRLPREDFEEMVDAAVGAVQGAGEKPESPARRAEAAAQAAMLIAACILDPAAPAPALVPAARAWGLGQLRRSGTASGLDLDSALAESLHLADRAARALSAAAFPAVAFVTLLRADLRGRRPGDIERRLRLIWAVGRGQI